MGRMQSGVCGRWPTGGVRSRQVRGARLCIRATRRPESGVRWWRCGSTGGTWRIRPGPARPGRRPADRRGRARPARLRDRHRRLRPWRRGAAVEPRATERVANVPYAGSVTERVELDVDQGTAAYLRACARQRGGSMAVAAACQLRELALADSAAQHAAWAASEPSFFADAEAEREAALNA